MGFSADDRRRPHLLIADLIRAGIANGTYAVGDRIPTVRQLADENGVAYATASKALAALREEGLVESRPGRGTVVLTDDVTVAPSVQEQLDDLRQRVEALEGHHRPGRRKTN